MCLYLSDFVFVCQCMCVSLWDVGHICVSLCHKADSLPRGRRTFRGPYPWDRFSATVFSCGFILFTTLTEVTDSEYERVLLENGKDII